MQSEAHENHPDVPRTFWEYLRSFGPGIVVVLTWLGAGDIVGAGVAGGNYGYRLMWVLVLSVMVRFAFVSLIAKYQLCNPRGESVLDGLARLHPWYAPLLALASVVMAHVYGAYMLVGCGETWVKLTGVGTTWQWALVWAIISLMLIFQPVYSHIELVFKIILAVLAASLLGMALWVGPNPIGILRGAFTFSLPETVGPFGATLVAVSMIGAVGGSIMNLAYPYLLELKGWRGPAYRRVQMYDLLLGVIVMIILDLAVWTLGAELVHGSGKPIEGLDGLAALLAEVLGETGRRLFFVGVFCAVITSLIGVAMVLAFITSHGYLRWRAGGLAVEQDYKSTSIYRGVVIWALLSPLIWTMPGMPDFVTLTLVGNGVQVLLVPFLAGGLWWITASPQYIGLTYRNRWWENLVMLLAFSLSVWGSIGILLELSTSIRGMVFGDAL